VKSLDLGANAIVGEIAFDLGHQIAIHKPEPVDDQPNQHEGDDGNCKPSAVIKALRRVK